MTMLEPQAAIKKSKRMLWIVVVGGLAVLLIAGIVTALTIVKAQQPKPDRHAVVACTMLGRANGWWILGDGTFERNVIDEASQSSVPSLRKAARTGSPTDVKIAAIIKWCNDNRTA